MATLADEVSIQCIKRYMTTELCRRVNLDLINAPLFVTSKSRINDHLNSDTRIVSFQAKDGTDFEVVQSTAKWKRQRIAQLNVKEGSGIVVDMKAIRCDEDLTPIHSYLVDQWDWEFRIPQRDRTLQTLITKADQVYSAVKSTIDYAQLLVPELSKVLLPPNLKVVDTLELEQLYPLLTPKEREYEITKQYQAVLLTRIGYRHDKRAFDYDDYQLNADIIVWSDVLNLPIELSSMGVRVDSKAMVQQYLHCFPEASVPVSDLSSYHKDICYDALPFTIGGGIGQSRLLMFALQKFHISDVQAPTQ